MNPVSSALLAWTQRVYWLFESWGLRRKGVRMNRVIPIAVRDEDLAELCRRHHIRRLAFFGSVLREDFRPDSDVDVLVEFETGRTPGFAFFGIQEELSRLLGRKVDLNTPGFLSPYYRDEVLREAQDVYVAAS
jgi:hypothetical protein